MGHVDSSQITPLYNNTTPGITADANVFDPAIAAMIVAINENFDSFETFKLSVTLPIPDQSIVERHLRNLAVTNPKLAPLSVTADKIADGTITTAKLADMVVTAAKIADGTITEPKYATGSVSSRAIANSAVGAAQIDGSLLLAYPDVSIRAEFDKRGINIEKYSNLVVGSNWTAAIQAAVDEAISLGGGNIIFPYGTYVVSTINVINASNITFIGNFTTLEQTSQHTNGLFYVTGSNNIMFKNLKLKGNGVIRPGGTGYQYHGINVSTSTHITISKCEIFNMPSGGILTNNSSYITIHDNYLHGNLDLFDIAFGYAIPTVPLKGFTCYNNRCESQNLYGIHVQGFGEKVSMYNNIVKDKGEYGIMVYLFASGSEVWTDISIVKNFVENVSYNAAVAYYSGMGIYLQTAERVVCSQNTVKNVLLNRPDVAAPNRTLSPAAISINGSTEVTCNGNIIDGSGIDGIDIVNTAGYSRGTTVSDNIILGCVVDGVYIQAASNVVLSNNVIEGNAGKVGVAVLSSSTLATKQIQVINNRIIGFEQGFSVAKGTGTEIEGVMIQSNSIQDCSKTFIIITDGVDISIINNIIKSVSITHQSTFYAIQASTCTDITINNNVATGKTGFFLRRGISVTTCSFGLITNNIIKNITDSSLSINLSSNTSVFFYGNLTDRNPIPLMGVHNIGNDPSTDTTIRILYRTSIPDASVGNCAQGSVAYNLAATSGGKAGWICTATGTPGTWKAFGVIDV